MTKEEIINNLNYQNKKFYDGQSRTLIEAIKLIEQQPSEDCVSRQAVLKGYIEIERADGVEVYSDRVIPREYVEALPPVTPTHGTCKDCRHYVGALIDNAGDIYKTSYCRKHGKNVHREDFYCADFEKRGDENE